MRFYLKIQYNISTFSTTQTGKGSFKISFQIEKFNIQHFVFYIKRNIRIQYKININGFFNCYLIILDEIYFYLFLPESCFILRKKIKILRWNFVVVAIYYISVFSTIKIVALFMSGLPFWSFYFNSKISTSYWKFEKIIFTLTT